jgi:hypothetical protein
LKADECSGSTLNDSSGNGWNGTITIGASGEDTVGNCQTASTAWGDGVTGKRNYSLKLDGTDDYVSLGDFAISENATQSAWAMWVKPGTLSTSDCLWCKFNSGTTSTAWGIETGSSDSSVIRGYLSSSTTDLSTYGETPSGMLTNSTWSHVVMVYDSLQATNATRLKIYVNGVQRTLSFSGTIPIRSMDSTVNARIGSTSDGSAGRFFNGQIDDVMYFNYAPTAAQVKSLYNSGAVRWGPNEGAP